MRLIHGTAHNTNLSIQHNTQINRLSVIIKSSMMTVTTRPMPLQRYLQVLQSTMSVDSNLSGDGCVSALHNTLGSRNTYNVMQSA